MTLDEAIKHCKEKAEELKNQYGELANKRPEPIEEQMRLLQEKHDCLACANEHEQLAEWLEDYKRLLEERPQASNNAELFKQTFGFYATEVWSMRERDFLEWLNSEVKND